MGVKAWVSACAAAMACVWANGAAAGAITFTYEGTVAAGSSSWMPAIDNEGLFGPAGASLVGDRFTAVLKYDNPGVVNIGTGDIGGLYGTGAGEAYLTINGITIEKSILNVSLWRITNIQGIGTCPTCYHVMLSAGGENPMSHGYEYTPSIDFDINLGYETYKNWDGSYTNASGDVILDGSNLEALFVVDSATVDPMPPAVYLPVVPEPMTWALMLTGLGAIGAALRLSRRKDGAAPAAA